MGGTSVTFKKESIQTAILCKICIHKDADIVNLGKSFNEGLNQFLFQGQKNKNGGHVMYITYFFIF